MRFGVILTVDCQRQDSIKRWYPPNVRLFQLTEGDDQREMEYISDGWRKHKHRKWVGEISREQFDALVEKLNLKASSTPTMGSLGVPWTPGGMGLAPAICFEEDSHELDAYVQAYVTPLPEVRCPIGRDAAYYDRCWERVRRAVLAIYGRNRR